MDPMTAFLFSMQAAGLVSSLYGAKSQQKLIQIGRQLEKEQFTTNLQALRLQSSESSLDEMKQLRQNIGSQIALNAARGNRGGSSYSGIERSTGAFSNDERKRRMNLLANESQLRANNVLSGLHSLQSESQLGQTMAKQFLDIIPVTSLFKTKGKQSQGIDSDGGFFNWGY